MAIVLQEVLCWKFIRFKKAGGSSECVVRAPVGSNITCVDCGNQSYGQVLAILEVRGVAMLLVRWLTPVYAGSYRPLQFRNATGTRQRGQPPISSIVHSNYTGLKLTNTVVCIPIDHVLSTAHIVPNFKKMPVEGEYFFCNSTPLGSTKRAVAWESLLASAEACNNQDNDLSE